MPRLPLVRAAALFTLSVAAAFAQPCDVVPVRAGPFTQSLNGTWSFKYTPGSGAQFGDDLAGFAPIIVPGHWELQGFAEPKYGKTLAEGIGLYQRTFRVPADWAGRRVMLRFAGVLYGYEAWVNGVSVGSWASAYNPAVFDITDQLKPGADNVLRVRVTTRSHGWEFDTNDCWSISGIYRDVSLFAVPAAYLQDWSARTKLNPDGSATLTVTTLTSAPAGVSGRLLAPDGRVVQEFKAAAEAGVAATVAVNVEQPRLWTAETPVLYTLELTLSSRQSVAEKIGLREISIVDGVLQLNGRPVKLHGVDHHDLWPEAGRAATEELMRRDLELMRAANINFIRTSHYPPHWRFLELCDELGFYVMDEVPFGFGDEHLTDPTYQPDLLIRARATVKRDQNRACVIVWSVGNENPITPIQLETGREVKRLDPTRPICFPTVGSYFARNYEKFPEFVDIYSPHYPSTATVQEYATKFTRPVIFTEYAHALGLATDLVQTQWAIMQASPRIAGGAVWMFQDQGIRRTAAPGVTPGTSHNLGLAVWPDATHYYDSDGNQGMDGIVYSDRTPSVDYWEVRKVYSSVQLSAPTLVAHSGTNEFSLTVENRFDFRALTGLKLAWSLVRDGKSLQTGSAPLSAAARSTETVKLPVTWPADAPDGFTWLEVRVLDERGTAFYERNFRVAPEAPVKPRTRLLAGLPAEKLELQTSAGAFTVTHPDFMLTLERATGGITLTDATGSVLATGFEPHAGRRFTEGEFVRAKKELTWSEAFLAAAPGVETSVSHTPEGIRLQVHGRYPRPSAPEQALEGDMTVFVHPTGTIDVSYDYVPVNGQGLLLEAGLALVVPAAAPEFHWIGAGPYAGYPGKDVLNEFGIYHLNRGDLNFQGNRREVEFAALTSPAGTGVLLIPDQPADIAVENIPAGTMFSHNALLSGRGTKSASPDTYLKAEAAAHIAGKFTLLPLTTKWPAQLKTWFGAPSTAKPFAPYYHSYDQ